MPLSAAGSALVAGSSQESTMQAQQKQPQTASVRVVRAFYLNGKPTKVNETIDVPRLLALELKAANKVEIVAVKAEPKAEEKPEAKKTEAKAAQKAFI